MQRATRTSPTTWILSAAMLIVAGSVHASNPALDRAGNYTTFADTTNRGFGYAAGFTFQTSGSAGFFLGDSKNNGNGNSGNINTTGTTKSWGLFANSGGLAQAFRGFSGGALSVNQWFAISVDNGYIDSGAVGFSLRNSGGDNLFEVYFRGGQANYKYSNNSAESDSGIGFSTDGIRIDFQLTSTSGYQFRLRSPVSGSGSVFTGLLNNFADKNVTNVRIWNSNAGFNGDHDAYFNEIAIPEPTSFLLIIGLATLRRRPRI